MGCVYIVGVWLLMGVVDVCVGFKSVNIVVLVDYEGWKVWMFCEYNVERFF